MTEASSVTSANSHSTDLPSPWVQRWSHLVTGGTVLDVACGEGRHLRWFASRGLAVVGVDRSAQALASVQLPGARCELICADIEQGPWPLLGRQFDGVVVTNYLWRPLLPVIAQSLAPNGVLIYETFATGQETIGRPARPDFLLQTGELLRAFAELRTVAFEDGFEPPSIARATGRFVQRIAAVREPSAMELAPARPRLN